MRFRRTTKPILEGDMTPMIDMTFQLIAFFMLIINFSTVERSEELELPDSPLARPPAAPPDYQIVLNLNPDGSVLFAGRRIDRAELLRPHLSIEADVAAREGVPREKINVIIRADRTVPTGLVQELMARCQEVDLQLFSLRVNETLD